MDTFVRYEMVMALQEEARRQAAEQRLARRSTQASAPVPSIRVSIRRALGLSAAA